MERSRHETLLDRLASTDSVREMEQAAEDRYWDALTCGLESRSFGACYLLGYVVEMLLKCAFFRYDGRSLDSDLRPYLSAAAREETFRRGDHSRRFAGHPLHNIEAWINHLVEARDRADDPLDPRLAARLIVEGSWVARNWSEAMRYRRSVEAGPEAERFLEVADWIRSNHMDLWS